MLATYPTIKNTLSFKGVNMVGESRTVQYTTRFRELFLHSTDKPCSTHWKSAFSLLHMVFAATMKNFQQTLLEGLSHSHHRPSRTDPQLILFMLGLNTLYSCQSQVTCSWKYEWLFLKLRPQSRRTDKGWHSTTIRMSDKRTAKSQL
jgi:hypothetical protein